jgi:hypothetical protein
VRSIDDIKTLSETLEDSDWQDENINPDLTRTDIKNAVKSGKITVYSSYPIENGVKLPSVLKYSMPENWDWKDELDERVNAFLADYITASWMGLTAEVTMPVLELMSILNKRKKPI